jgi:hypothetical protein
MMTNTVTAAAVTLLHTVIVSNGFSINGVTLPAPPDIEHVTNWVRIASTNGTEIQAAQVTEQHWLDVVYQDRTNRFLLLSKPQTNGVTEIRAVPSPIYVWDGRWDVYVDGDDLTVVTNIIIKPLNATNTLVPWHGLSH